MNASFLPDTIDIDVLRDVLAQTESMVAHYAKSDEKLAQNAALVAAGLRPLHSEGMVTWDQQQAAKKRREAECLRAVLTHLATLQPAQAA